MAGSVFINACIFNHAPVVHTFKSQLGSTSGKDDLILLVTVIPKLRSTNPPDLIFSSCSLSFDGTTCLLAFCQVLCLLKPLAIYPCQLLQLSLQVTDQFIMKAKRAAWSLPVWTTGKITFLSGQYEQQDTAFACYRLLQLSREYRWLGGISLSSFGLGGMALVHASPGFKIILLPKPPHQIPT